MLKEAVNARRIDDKDKLTLLLRDQKVIDSNLKPNREDAHFRRHDNLKKMRWKLAQRWGPRWEMINCPYPHIQGPTLKCKDRRDIQNSKRDNTQYCCIGL